jgi:soluble lytic murein transglycosylase-like protein
LKQLLLAALMTLALDWGGDGEAQPYTAADTIEAIDQASTETGVSRTWIYATVKCETGGTFNPYAIGRQGELGAAQLHPQGELPRFFAWGYTDPFNPSQAILFLAQRFAVGGARAWSCA